MKKVIYAIAALAAAALALSSCGKEQFIEEGSSISAANTSANGTNTAATGATVISVSIESGASAESNLTKTALSGSDAQGYEVLWSKGDRIKVIGTDGFDMYYTLAGDGGSTKGAFTGDLMPDGDYRALYSISGTQLPTTQLFNEGKTDDSPMYAEFKVSGGVASEASFWNLCGLLRINIGRSDGKKVRSIEVSADQYMAGLITIYGDKHITITEGTWPLTPSKSVTLDCGEQGVAVSPNSADFCIALPANDYTGVKMVISYTDGNSDTKTLKSDETLSISRSQLTPVSFKMYPDDALSGVFTVSSDGRKVLFARGNLKYDVNNAEWGFFDKQNYFISESEGQNASSSVISHFTWGLGEWSADPYTTTFSATGAFKDWGEAIDSKGTWRTLTKDEWEYIFNTHTYRFVTINGYEGCLIAPDRILGDYIFNTEKSSYSSSEWAKAEAAGFVFLPKDGRREGEKVAVDQDGYYWSSSEFKGLDNNSWYMDFTGNIPVYSNNNYPRSNGMSVRLVTEMK